MNGSGGQKPREEITLMKERLVLVGNGMAGMRTLEELLAIAPDLSLIHI